MLRLEITDQEYYDDSIGEFITIEPMILELEHSLLSMSKWEAKYCKAFLEVEKTGDEILDYVRMMTIFPEEVPWEVYKYMSKENIDRIQEYILSPQTATTFKEKENKKSREYVSSELIYYWMTANSIPFECEKWPLNRLLTLIHICGIKNNPDNYKKAGKKGSKPNYSKRAALNAARKAKYGSRG